MVSQQIFLARQVISQYWHQRYPNSEGCLGRQLRHGQNLHQQTDSTTSRARNGYRKQCRRGFNAASAKNRTRRTTSRIINTIPGPSGSGTVRSVRPQHSHNLAIGARRNHQGRWIFPGSFSFRRTYPSTNLFLRQLDGRREDESRRPQRCPVPVVSNRGDRWSAGPRNQLEPPSALCTLAQAVGYLLGNRIVGGGAARSDRVARTIHRCV